MSPNSGKQEQSGMADTDRSRYREFFSGVQIFHKHTEVGIIIRKLILLFNLYKTGIGQFFRMLWYGGLRIGRNVRDQVFITDQDIALFACIIYRKILILAGWARASDTWAISKISSSCIESSCFLSLIWTVSFLPLYYDKIRRIFQGTGGKRIRDRCNRGMEGQSSVRQISVRNGWAWQANRIIRQQKVLVPYLQAVPGNLTGRLMVTQVLLILNIRKEKNHICETDSL